MRVFKLTNAQYKMSCSDKNLKNAVHKIIDAIYIKEIIVFL